MSISLKEMLKGNVVAVGKNYKELSGEELRLLLSLKCLSNKNNYIVGTNKSILISLFKLDKRTFDKHFNALIEKEFIFVEGEISKVARIQIFNDDVFETFEVEFILNMLNDLTGAEIKLFCTLTTYLNEDKNRNYIYPSVEDIAKKYYEGELTEEELERKIKNKGIDKIKNNLIEKGYIKNVVAFFFERKDGSKGVSKLAYFLKTNKNEVSNDEYYSFIKNEINKYNESHNNILKLATEDYLKKCKYKNLDKYIFYKDIKTEEELAFNKTASNNKVELETNTEYSSEHKSKFDELMNEHYGFKENKRLKDAIIKYGYEKIVSFFISYQDHIYNFTAKDEVHRANIFMKNKFDKLIQEFIAQEEIRESKANIQDDVEIINTNYNVPRKRKSVNERLGLTDVLSNAMNNKVDNIKNIYELDDSKLPF